ncbi:TPA: DUF257 family protein [Pyrococcus horikoshii]|uniref:DUF257 family protein n=1 Tax=Pyrococcus horikoshii TaxID=53953 RepID=A0A832T746_PYRHR|nr:DUF257 family protein [Pyrococcus horikoshii]
MILQEFLKSKKFGETILVENDSPLGIEALTSYILEYAKQEKLPVLIEDILDTFPIYIKHLKLMNRELDLSSVNVMKIGGVEDIGNVVSRLKLESDPSIYISRYTAEFSRVASKENFIDMIFGVDRLFTLDDTGVLTYEILASMKQYSTRKDRLAFYFVEKKIIENIPTNPLLALEDIGTSVLMLNQERDILIIKFVKDAWSIKSKVKEIKISIEDLT